MVSRIQFQVHQSNSLCAAVRSDNWITKKSHYQHLNQTCMIPDWPPAARTWPSERKVPEYACKNYSKLSSVEKRIVETHTNSTFPLAPQKLETRTQPQIELSASNGNPEICCKWTRFQIFKYMIGLGKTYHIVETCYPLLHLTSVTIVNDYLRKPKNRIRNLITQPCPLFAYLEWV